MRTHLHVTPWLLLLAVACGGESKGSAADAIAKAVDQKKEAKKDEPKVAPKPKVVDPTAAPWTVDAIRAAMVPGTKLVYERSGVDAKGKKVGGKLTYALSNASDDGATTSYTLDPDPGTNKASSQPANTPWSTLGPFFAMEKPTPTISGREEVTVPAGTFMASKAEIADFFGNHKTVWMIVDKPGVHAKVIESANTSTEGDKTQITY
ncbi:MAG: hypothetical protein IAG13_31395, partial [Deltaproteobacteria bacterium]|nr:hypothetical protein [Nannocystaceae bacterium]